MDPLLIISPHLDDAVLSCGQLMAGRPDTIVATAFTGTPDPATMLTTYDRDCGFRSADHAMQLRRQEDVLALTDLHAQPVHFGLLDHQYRELLTDTPGPKAVERALTQRLLASMSTLTHGGGHVVIGPLGLAHPDHLLVASAYRAALLEWPELEAWVYEDMPSRVLWPEQVGSRLTWWDDVLPGADHGWDLQLGFLGTGPIEAKEAAIDTYRSQLWALDRHTVLVPERHHRLVRA